MVVTGKEQDVGCKVDDSTGPIQKTTALCVCAETFGLALSCSKGQTTAVYATCFEWPEGVYSRSRYTCQT